MLKHRAAAVTYLPLELELPPSLQPARSRGNRARGQRCRHRVQREPAGALLVRRRGPTQDGGCCSGTEATQHPYRWVWPAQVGVAGRSVGLVGVAY